MPHTLCERVAAPLIEMHRKTTPPAATVVLGIVGLCVAGYGLAIANLHIAWGGALVTVVGWYGFLLSGCEKLLAEKDRQIEELKKVVHVERP